MLSYALAIAVAISSLVLFSTAFLMSDIHRQDDFLWSAVGLIYALVLWFCARNITGAVLLGQAAASILLVSYSWQTLKLRKALVNPDQAPEINNFSWLKKINGLLSRKKSRTPVTTTPAVTTPNPKVTESEIAIPDTASQDDSTTPPTQPKASQQSNLSTDKPEEIAPEPQPNNSSPTSKEIVPEVTQPQVNQTKIVVEPVAKDPTSLPAETKTATKSEIAPQPETAISEVASPSVISTAKEATPKPVDSQKTVINNVIAKDSITPPQAKPESMTKTSQPLEEKSAIEPKTPNALDSLETVEVAEVLEAMPEDISNRKNQDRSNIIEVKTTEIDSISPEKKTEQDSD